MRKNKMALILSSAFLLSSVAVGAVGCSPESITSSLTFIVTVSENEDCKIGVDKDEAVVGDTVTVTVSDVASGKRVSQVRAGATVLASNANNVYTFVMPAANVTVSVDLEDIPTTSVYSIALPEVEGATITSSKDEALAGEVISIVVDVTDTTKRVKQVKANNLTVGADGSGAYSFTMPAENVTISVTLELIPVDEVYDITLPTLVGATVTSNVSSSVAGAKIEVSVAITDQTKRVASVKANGLGVSTDSTGAYSFIMPAEDVEVEVVLETKPTPTEYTISLPTVAGATVTCDHEKATVGTRVVVTVEVTDNTKQIKEVTANNVAVGAYMKGKYAFTMPEDNVSVSVELEDIPVPATYKVTSKVDDGAEITINKVDGLLPGEKVTVTVKVNDDSKMIDSVMADDMVLAADSTGAYTFAMPEKDVEVVVTLKNVPIAETYTVSWAESEEYSVVASSTTGLVAGDAVTLTITNHATTKVIEKVLANSVELAMVAQSDGSVQCTFNMPADDVTVTVSLLEDPNLIPTSLGFEESTSSYGAHWQDYYEIKYTTVSNTSAFITEALPGTEVYVWFFNKETTQTKAISQFRLNTELGWVYCNTDDNFSTRNWCGAQSAYGDRYKFTVGTMAVSPNPSVKDYEYTINYTSANNSSYVTFYNQDEKAAANETVRVYPVARQNYTITGIVVHIGYSSSSNVVDATYNSSSNYWQFTMPADEVYIEALYEGIKTPIGISTDAHASVSNFRIGTSGATAETYSAGPNTDDAIALLVSHSSRLYFTVTADSGYEIGTVQMRYADNTTGSIILSGDDYYISSVPSQPFTIEVTTYYRYTNATFSVVDTDGATVTAEQAVVTYYGDMYGEDPLPEGVVLSGDERFGLSINNLRTDGAYTFSSVSVNGSPISYVYTRDNSGLVVHWFWLDTDDYADPETGEVTLNITITLQFNALVYDTDSDVPGDYLGRTISSSGSNAYLRVANTGIFGYGSSSSNLIDNDGVLKPTSTANVYATDDGSVRLIKDGDYALYLASTTSMSSNAIVIKGQSSTLSNPSVATVDTESNVVIVRMGSSSAYTFHLVDLSGETPVFRANLTSTGNGFSSGAAITLTDGEEVVGNYKFTSASACTSYTPDAYAGTYTSADSTLGDLVLDGAGGATLGAFSSGTYSYTSEDLGNGTVKITLTGGDNYNRRTIREVVIDTSANTYTESNADSMFHNSSVDADYFSSDINASDGNTYRIKINMDADHTLRFEIATVTDGVAGSYSLRSSFCQFYEDLRANDGTIGIVLNDATSAVTSLSGYASVVITYNIVADTYTMNAVNFGVSSAVTFDLTNMVFARGS